MTGPELQASIIDYHFRKSAFGQDPEMELAAKKFILAIAELLLRAYGIPTTWEGVRVYLNPFKSPKMKKRFLPSMNRSWFFRSPKFFTYHYLRFR